MSGLGRRPAGGWSSRPRSARDGLPRRHRRQRRAATIGEDLDATLAELQWVINGYLLSLASLILLGGSLGDRYGRRRIFVIGTVWFALASLLCGLAPDPSC